MKKRWIAVILCLLLLLLAASACGKEEDGSDSLLNQSTSKTEQSTSDSQNSSEDSGAKGDSTDSKETTASKDNSKKENISGSTASSSSKGTLTEKKAMKLVFKQAEADYSGGSVYVKENSGEILDQNDTAYIVGFEICTKGHEENNFTEAYWINKKTKEIRDVCGVNEYFDGMIDITNGTALF